MKFLSRVTFLFNREQVEGATIVYAAEQVNALTGETNLVFTPEERLIPESPEFEGLFETILSQSGLENYELQRQLTDLRAQLDAANQRGNGLSERLGQLATDTNAANVARDAAQQEVSRLAQELRITTRNMENAEALRFSDKAVFEQHINRLVHERDLLQMQLDELRGPVEEVPPVEETPVPPEEV